MKKKYPPIELDDKMRFGKHKGETVATLIENNHGYIDWLVDNGVIELSNQAYEYFQKLSK